MDLQSTQTRLPRINEKAPSFKAASTHGDIKLEDYKGSWLVLFSHPADFTPVCTTELIAFSKRSDDFAAINTKLLGLSVDSVFSHIAWMRSIKEKFEVEIAFPLLADLSMEVANLYGMIHPGAGSTAAVRAVFIIDPNQEIKALVYYPMTAGRSVDEIFRLVQALQTNHEKGLPTPEGWVPGNACIIPPPKTIIEANERLKSRHKVTDWYFSQENR